MSSVADVSVIIPTYNRQSVLARALDSVLSQSQLPAEVIVVDDGSTDNTQALMTDYPDIRYVQQSNQGVSSARNHGIKLSSGEWIALLDSDDAWHPAKLETQLEWLKQTKKLIGHTDEIWIRDNKRVNSMLKHRKKGGWIFPDCLSLCLISPSAVLIHRDLFRELGLFDERLPACEDYDLWLRITAQYEVAFIDEPLTIKYGGHADQLSKQYWGMDRFRIQSLEKCLAQDWLSGENRRLAIEMLRHKISIYCQGAKKRGKIDEVSHYQSLLHRYV